MLPCYLNPTAGTAAAASRALRKEPRLDLREMPPEDMRAAIAEDVARGTRRIVVAGGDGTVACAAAAVAGTETELGIIPAGTLNHFARGVGISLDTQAACELAASGEAVPTDIGYVNDQPFLNTCSVGAYVDFVRTRELWEPRLGYFLASMISSLRTLSRLPRVRVTIELEDRSVSLQTPLVFVGVGEREIRIPMLGNRVPGGEDVLHVIAVEAGTRLQVFAMTLRAAMLGISQTRSPELQSWLLDNLVLRPQRANPPIALDGEVTRLASPLRFRHVRGALWLVRPA